MGLCGIAEETMICARYMTRTRIIVLLPFIMAVAMASAQTVEVRYYDPLPEKGSFVADSAAMARDSVKTHPAYIIDNHPRGRFRWGADVGTTIDMTGQDASSYDISISLGFSRKWINFLGFGAKACFAVGNSSRAFPLFLNFRTNFKNTPSVVFWDLKGGVALNYPGDNRSHVGAYAATGVGFYLARSSTFSSHILVGYTYRQQDAMWTPQGNTVQFKDLHMATFKIGVMF